MSETLSAEWNSHTTQLLLWTDALSPSQLTQRAAPDKWSVADVLEHMFIVEKGAARVMLGPSEMVERDLERSRNRMASGLGNLDAKYAGGNNMDPKGRFEDYAAWRGAYLANRAAMLQATEQLGAMGRCTLFPHPFFGELTRAEWLIFAMLHADRHLAQMAAFVV